MDRQDYYNDFIKSINLKIDNLVKELHLVQINRCKLINSLEKYKNVYLRLNIKLDVIYNTDVIKKIYYNKKHIKQLNSIEKALLDRYNHIVYKKYKIITKQLKVLTVFKDIPLIVFTNLQDEYNIEIINSILKGNKYSFGIWIGTIKIKYYKLKFRRPYIDFNESLKYKRLLLSQGKSVMSKNNLDGHKWFIYGENEDFCYFRWNKYLSRNVNKKYYKFRPIANKNEANQNTHNMTEEEILNDRSLGGSDKLFALMKNNPSIKERYDEQYLYK